MRGRLRIDHLKRFLVASIAGLVLLHLVGQISAHLLGRGRLMGFVGMFRLQSEHNAPTYFSGWLLGLSALLLLLIGCHVAGRSVKRAVPWFGLCAVFGYLACDELLSIHERFHFLGESMSAFDALNYKWVVMGGLLVLAVVALFSRFWWNLPHPTRYWFAVAAGVYVAGAIGVETLCGLYAKAHSEDFAYALLTAVEEGMEMAGIACFIVALARYIQPRFEPLGIALVTEPTAGVRERGMAHPARPASAALDSGLGRAKRVA
ncbi:MAG: hypothetical protein ACE37H_02530 [Phycisphaeraceae bacterium]